MSLSERIGDRHAKPPKGNAFIGRNFWPQEGDATPAEWGAMSQDGSGAAAAEEVEDEEEGSGDSKRKKMKEGLASLFGKGPKKDQ